MKKLFLLFFVYLSCAADDTSKVTADFIKSFVTHYDFSSQGRFTHEYHPFLLEKTKESLQRLEKYLQKKGFICAGRIVVMGYQQEGVPSYYPSFSTPVLTDEASLTSKRGRVVPAHNIFGFLTGFLLKDANWLQTKWFSTQSHCVEHILPERVGLFDDKAYIFQKHAFGKDFDVILEYRKAVEKSLKTGDPKNILNQLITFWQKAYQGELKSCSQETLATQDILFSIDYAKHLTLSSIPLSKIYIGPDITYPIEILPFQERYVTESAQYFVRHFVPTLQPIEDKKTVYVFCSFVDGVGKSTLLGNVINWIKYQDNLQAYERVDNSSSQIGVLYKIASDVFIMDLPAQLSHWVSKPDGYVFVDSMCVKELDPQKREKLAQYVQQHTHLLRADFKNMCEEYERTKQLPKGFIGNYLENVMLGESEELWIPFVYEKWTCIFSEQNNSQIRVLVPLEGVHSKGLKMAQPEQMLFSEGLLVPLKFEIFMDDVVTQCKAAGIERVVFVDFLSMYPRTSRETVRVNFLLQHLKKIHGRDFPIKKSLYRTFIHKELELYHMLRVYKEDFAVTLAFEALARAALYALFLEQSSDQVTTITSDQVTHYLRSKHQELLHDLGPLLKKMVEEKIVSEQKTFEKYALDRKYELFIRFSAQPLLSFSRFIENLFLYQFQTSHVSELWQGMQGTITDEQNMVSETMFDRHQNTIKIRQLLGAYKSQGCSYLSSGIPFTCLEKFHESCRDQVTLSPLFALIRAHWYGVLLHLLWSEETFPDKFICQTPALCVPPLAVKKAAGGMIVLVQKQLPVYEEELSGEVRKTLRLLNNYHRMQDISWGQFQQMPYCMEWTNVQTQDGVYGFGYDWASSSLVRKIIRDYCKNKKAEGYEDPAIFTTDLVHMLTEMQGWQLAAITKTNQPVLSSSKKDKKIPTDSARARAIALWVRAIATLEMICKDAHSTLITRKGVQEDFSAAVQLLERITLPRYFGITFDKPLFEDYMKVQPVIPWDVIQS